jgi:hypothetical protein
MKNRTLIASFSLAVLSLFAVGAQAQHAQHHPAGPTFGAGMMGGGMMGQGLMGQKMMAQRPAMQALMDQLRQNMTALENEKDPSARAKLMAEQCALLGKMHSEMTQQGQATGGLMENCPIMSTNQQATDPTAGVEFGGGS